MHPPSLHSAGTRCLRWVALGAAVVAVPAIASAAPILYIGDTEAPAGFALETPQPATASASSTYWAAALDGAIDGDPATHWNSGWSGDAAYTITFAAPREVSGLHVLSEADPTADETYTITGVTESGDVISLADERWRITSWRTTPGFETLPGNNFDFGGTHILTSITISVSDVACTPEDAACAPSNPSWIAIREVELLVADDGGGGGGGLFEETFEGGFNELWTGKSYGGHNAELVPDPVRPGNTVMHFTALNSAGDLFSEDTIETGGVPHVVQFEYYSPLPVDGGGCIGYSYGLPDSHDWPLCDSYYYATSMPSGGQWTTCQYELPPGTPTHIMIEEFGSYPIGNAYFDNIHVVPGTGTGCTAAPPADGDGDGVADGDDLCNGEDASGQDADGDGCIDPPACQATLCSGVNFTGACETFTEGFYDFPYAVDIVGNDNTRSLMVEGGARVELWQHYTPYLNPFLPNGYHLNYFESDADITGNALPIDVSSIAVFCDADTTDVDTDGDGIRDFEDNCPTTPATTYDGCPSDTDGDGVDDDYDLCPGGDDNQNSDADGIPDDCDACPIDTFNDSDGDFLCDSDDPCIFDFANDVDGDGLCFDEEAPGCDQDPDNDADGDWVCAPTDACPYDAANDADGDGLCADVDDYDTCHNAYDSDGDGTPDGCDLCPYDYFNDTDFDGLCDSDDSCPLDNPDDSDGDGSCDSDDNCRFDADNDADGDGVCGDVDACPVDPENDGDGDGVCESTDNCDGVSNVEQTNLDGDAYGDACEPDADSDGVVDDFDNCRGVANANQADADRDGQGDACDGDDDGDSVSDGNDQCANTPLGTTVLNNGCSVAQTCPPANDWKNHGAYVACVTQAAGTAVRQRRMTVREALALIEAAARSNIGYHQRDRDRDHRGHGHDRHKGCREDGDRREGGDRDRDDRDRDDRDDDDRDDDDRYHH